MEERKVDFTKYPEGFDAMVEMCDFLPDDKKIREGYVEGMVGFLLSM